MSPSYKTLLVEDDQNDTFFVLRAMAKASLPEPLHICTNGQEAIDYLSGAAPFGDRNAHPLPHCIFLDLKLPLVHGFQVLEWIRAQPSLKELPVFILTSSPEEGDRKRAQQLGANAYLIKPPTPEMLTSALNLLQDPSTIAPAAATASYAANRL